MTVRRAVAAASMTLLALAGSAMLAVGAVASDGVVASATGQGGVYISGELRTFAFSAIKKADGTVEGHAFFLNRATGVKSQAELNCLNVGVHTEGNIAVMSGIITESTAPIEGLTAVIAVQDRGEGANEPQDRMTNTLAVGTSLTCNDFAPNPAPALFDIDLGNIQVVG